VELPVNALPEPGLRRGGHRLLQTEPGHSAVLIRLPAHGGRRVCLQQVGHIQMQVGGDVGAPLLVAVHSEDFQRVNVGRYRTHRRESALLPDFPHGYRQQIPVPVRVAAQPGPGVVEVVVRHQHLCQVRAHHPGGGRQVPGSVV
ncbi:hypothetical protein GOGPGP_GOGPGP_05215, partial [Dysosmobacter welbionis]